MGDFLYKQVINNAMDQYSFIFSIDELRPAVRMKTDYQLIREFTFWSIKQNREELKVMLFEIRQRKNFLLKFIFVALFTNTIEFLNEIVNIERSTYFQDSREIIIRRCILGVIKLLFFPLITIGYLINGGVWYGIFFPISIFIIGMILTLNDLINFKILSK